MAILEDIILSITWNTSRSDLYFHFSQPTRFNLLCSTRRNENQCLKAGQTIFSHPTFLLLDIRAPNCFNYLRLTFPSLLSSAHPFSLTPTLSLSISNSHSPSLSLCLSLCLYLILYKHTHIPIPIPPPPNTHTHTHRHLWPWEGLLLPTLCYLQLTRSL